jgi:gluconolactonase
MYFTDNGFFQDTASFESVFYLSPEGDLSRIISDLGRPNGIALSPDETKLYVSAPTVDPFSGNGRLWEYDLTAPVVVANKDDIASGLFDGITVDPQGNIFASDFPNGVKAWAPSGNLILDVAFPDLGPPLGAGTTNVHFADEFNSYPKCSAVSYGFH